MVKRIERSKVMSEATACRRRQTIPVVGWNNDTLSKEHEQRPEVGCVVEVVEGICSR